MEAGDEVIAKKAGVGASGLSEWDQLVYCLWVVDYMMRNAGDLANAADMYPTVQSDGRELARRLGLSGVSNLFGLPRHEFEQQYFSRFKQVCEEIRGVEPPVA